ncbi:phage integrase [Methylomonas rapida]|uniref:Tyrosine-type recombinase/integrase n=1 Tax=Methylomonas rapida TaxID=2963939 RepID=A0ABY7GHW7_9GAMM|nr:tyrosine-type recombinase/integrase [Methylomonas rapida]WAR44567.1 tyrosine-type recombinase/integrase [Methylomonas rapida]
MLFVLERLAIAVLGKGVFLFVFGKVLNINNLIYLLMTMPKKDGNKWKVDIRPDGVKGRRVIRLFDSKAEAAFFEKNLLSGRFEPISDNRRFSDLVNLWYDLHGQTLKSSIDTKNRLLKIAEVLNDPIARNFDVSLFSRYRQDRLQSGINVATLNRELSTLKALYRELKRLSVISYECPFEDVRKFKEKQTELRYLTKDEISRLFDSVHQSKNSSLFYVVSISLATGARWSEAEGLKIDHVRNKGFYFPDTKNGQFRFIPVDVGIYESVYRYLRTNTIASCYGAFRSAFKRASLTCPPGQLAHVLRHTFASHFIMNGGNIRTLQQLLGHSSLNVTMRYAHLAPNFLESARSFNPLSGMDIDNKWKEKGKES